MKKSGCSGNDFVGLDPASLVEPAKLACDPGLSPRRLFLRTALAVGASLSLLHSARANADKPESGAGVGATDQGAISAPPQPGDHFAFVLGDKKGEIKVDDLEPGGPQVQAYPMDPKTGVIRNGSRLNLVVLVRLDPTALSDETNAHAAQGVVAYSGVCTHQGCPVVMWSSERSALFCSCHGAMYDPKNGAEVLDGPAPRALAALPLKIENGVPIVAGAFAGRVGSEIK